MGAFFPGPFLPVESGTTAPRARFFKRSWRPLNPILARRHNGSRSFFSGLDKLLEAGQSVEILSKELVVKEKDLAVASVKADRVRLFYNSETQKIF